MFHVISSLIIDGYRITYDIDMRPNSHAGNATIWRGRQKVFPQTVRAIVFQSEKGKQKWKTSSSSRQFYSLIYVLRLISLTPSISKSSSPFCQGNSEHPLPPEWMFQRLPRSSDCRMPISSYEKLRSSGASATFSSIPLSSEL